jgi:archaeosortase A (PGF-CTERM-specific)
MSDLLAFAAFVTFALFLLAGRRGKVAAIAGWGCVVLNLFSELPALFAEGNLLYPLLTVLSLPFFVITAERILRADAIILQLSRTAAIATIIWVPFSLVPFLHDLVVAMVVNQAFVIITALGHHPQLFAWDVIAENGFYNQIILPCTGLSAIAILLGIAFGNRDLSARQVVSSFLLIVPVIWALNLLRVAMVFIAVSDQWFASFPDPRSVPAGDANFFWAHNVFAEGFAIIGLLLLVWALCRIIPQRKVFAVSLVRVYRDRIRAAVMAICGKAERDSL